MFRKGREQCVGCYEQFNPGDIFHDLGWGKIHKVCWEQYPNIQKRERKEVKYVEDI